MKTLFSLTCAALLLIVSPALAAGKKPAIPDFTKGDAIPEMAKHDWNLGPTGLRGWMFCDNLVTTDARQIAITAVDKGSPANGVLAAGDVLLGAGGKPFSFDPRTEMGSAITAAERETGGGKLALTRWRAGQSSEVVLKLPVMGTFSATAPFDCAKSKRVFDQGIKALAARVARADNAKKQDAIPRSLNALALLASGDAAHLPLVMARDAGVKDPEVARAIELSARLIRFVAVVVRLGRALVMLAGAKRLEGVDRDKLRTAIACGLQNQDGRARSGVGSIYERLSFDDIKPLLPAIHKAIVNPAPSGEMFADGVRLDGLRIFAKHHVEDGIQACADYLRDQNPWESQERTSEILKALLKYGAHARRVIPHLRETADYVERREKDFPKKLGLQKAKAVREAITQIEATHEHPELMRMR